MVILVGRFNPQQKERREGGRKGSGEEEQVIRLVFLPVDQVVWSEMSVLRDP